MLFTLPLPLRSCARGAAPGATSAAGERCSCSNWCLLVACTPPALKFEIRFLLLNTGGEVIFYHPLAAEELRPRHREGHYERAGGIKVCFLLVFVCCLHNITNL